MKQYDDINDFVRTKIKDMRIDNDLTAKKLSILIRQHEGYISRLENRKAFPTLEIIDKCCNVFSISVSEFFSSYPQQKAEMSQEEKKIQIFIRNMSKHNRQTLALLAERLEDK